MTARPVKRSVTLKGHRTSISLEEPFWRALKALAHEQRKPINVLVAEIDVDRGQDAGLASALRVYVLQQMEAKLSVQTDAL